MIFFSVFFLCVIITYACAIRVGGIAIPETQIIVCRLDPSTKTIQENNTKNASSIILQVEVLLCWVFLVDRSSQSVIFCSFYFLTLC